MPARILVVDDSELNRALLVQKLKAEYFDVRCAANGQEALECSLSWSPDLILLDVMMPGMDGYETCAALKNDLKTAHIPVVMITASEAAADKIRGLDVGADDFLPKPINDVVLFARIRSLVRLKSLIDELRLRRSVVETYRILEDSGLDSGVLHQANVLLVGGDEENYAKIKATLGEVHVTLVWVRTRQELEKATHNGKDFDVALIAHHLEDDDEDGLLFFSRLRSEDETRNLPVILLLAEELPETLSKALELGVSDYLFLPLDSSELLARLRTQIRRYRYHRSLATLLDSSLAMAYTDALTGVYNRRYLMATLDQKLMGIAVTHKPVAVAIFDIDHFKRVNDSYGHTAGDQVLQEVCARALSKIRSIDLFARYGGEEFTIVMPDSDEATAVAVAERVRSTVAASPFKLEGVEKPTAVSISLGVAITDDPNEEARDFLRRADEALYRSKRAGRNQLHVAPPANAVEMHTPRSRQGVQ